MSIRAKITLLVLLVGLSGAFLLGIIGYSSVSAVSRGAMEQRRIGAAIEGARALNAALTRLSDPNDLLLRKDGQSLERFNFQMEDLRLRVASCAATACHGYDKRPPQMAEMVLAELQMVHQKGREILASTEPGAGSLLPRWMEEVDAPARRVSRTTEEMSETLMAKSREIESSSRDQEKAAGLLVALTTVFFILMAVALSGPIARGITRPLERLTERSRKSAGTRS